MKRYIIALAVLLLVGFGYGEGDHSHHDEAKTTSITGEVMDMFCYFSHPKTGQGKTHAKCATKCIKKGIPVGIKTKDGVLYLAVGGDHGPANELLASYGGQVITVEGTIMEQDGIKMIKVSKVKS